jgi:predicted  nucleic acid-binding Zn-ribbon protein
MMAADQDIVDVKVDVGVLKTQVLTLTQLCDKIDKVIERLMDNQDRLVNQIYTDMDKRKQDTVADIKDLHSRITTVDRSLSDKLELTERRIMDEIKGLRDQITEHNEREDNELKKIMEWKWMAAGGIVVIVWLLSQVNVPELIGKLF